jgi:hypothetical protein
MNYLGYQDSPIKKDAEEKQEVNLRVEDPFDKVLLLKNIDNAILTSFRTMKEENNMVSETMKVVHNKF